MDTQCRVSIYTSKSAERDLGHGIATLDWIRPGHLPHVCHYHCRVHRIHTDLQRHASPRRYFKREIFTLCGPSSRAITLVAMSIPALEVPTTSHSGEIQNHFWTNSYPPTHSPTHTYTHSHCIKPCANNREAREIWELLENSRIVIDTSMCPGPSKLKPPQVGQIHLCSDVWLGDWAT